MISIMTKNQNFNGINNYEDIWSGTAIKVKIGEYEYIIPKTSIEYITIYPPKI